jgi:hypothetical protein
MLVMLNDHATELQRALEEVKDEYNIIIQSCLSAKGGIIQPQVLSPNHMIEILDSFPRDLQVPVPLSYAYSYLLINILSIDVYIVRTPLVSHYVYDVYRVLPFPTKINDTKSKYTFIQPEKEYILIDSTKQYYVKFRQEDIRKCKRINNKQVICEQEFPLFISHSASDCEVLMLQLIRTVPKTCAQSILELKETLWITLNDNSWIYVAPATTRMTILCSDQNPTDIEIECSGILNFLLIAQATVTRQMIRSLPSRCLKILSRPCTYTSIVVRRVKTEFI